MLGDLTTLCTRTSISSRGQAYISSKEPNEDLTFDRVLEDFAFCVAGNLFLSDSWKTLINAFSEGFWSWPPFCSQTID